VDGKIARNDRNRFDSRERRMRGCIRCVGAAGERCGFDYALTTFFFFSPYGEGDVIRTKGKRARTWRSRSSASARIAEKRYDGQKFQFPPGLIVAHVFNERAGYCYDDWISMLDQDRPIEFRATHVPVLNFKKERWTVSFRSLGISRTERFNFDSVVAKHPRCCQE